MKEVAQGTQSRMHSGIGEQLGRLKWIKVPLDFWIPPDLTGSEIGWFMNLLRASLQSEWPGYIMFGPETLARIEPGDAGTNGANGARRSDAQDERRSVARARTAMLARLAGCQHLPTWQHHGDKVLRHFEWRQVHEREVLYFQKLVMMLEEQGERLRKKKSRFPKNEQESEEGSVCSLPLAFDSDVGLGFKTKEVENVSMESEPKPLSNTPEEPLKSARRVIDILGMPATDGNLKVIEAAVVAEAAYTGQTFQEAAEQITKAAREDREVGIPINKFYFEDAKWRQSGRQNVRSRLNKAEQRKLDNLEVNARVKQHLQDLLDGS